MENLTEWMLPASVPSHSFNPDEVVTIVPEPGGQAVSVLRPDGSRRTLAPAGIASFADTDALGVYTVTQTVGSRQDHSWFSVNLFDGAISQIKPVDRLTLPPTRGVVGAQASRGQLDLWPWIVLLGLLALLAEWVVFHRGV